MAQAAADAVIDGIDWQASEAELVANSMLVKSTSTDGARAPQPPPPQPPPLAVAAADAAFAAEADAEWKARLRSLGQSRGK